jgi:hypothetical protein
VPASPFVPAGEELDGSMRFRRPPTLWLREAPHPDRQDRQRGARLPLRSAVRCSSSVLSVLYIFVKIGSAALIYLRCSSAALASHRHSSAMSCSPRTTATHLCAPARQMHSRRGVMYIYLSSLLRGKMRVLCASSIGEGIGDA